MGSCQASVSPASAISSTPLTIITEATNRRTARRGLVRCLVTAARECRPVPEGTGTLTALSKPAEGGRDPTNGQPDEPDRTGRAHRKCRAFVVGGGGRRAHRARL